MAKIILVRHGETDWNRHEVFRGQIDVPLNQNGLKQARALGDALKGQKLDAIYSSPLSRAVQTAEEIAKFQNLNVDVEDGFLDLSYGEWQGVSHEEVKARHPELDKKWHEQPHLLRFPGGESLDDVRERSMNALKRIASKHPDDTIVLVAHRVVNKVVLCAVLDLDNSYFWRIRQDTCCINIFEDAEIGYVLHRLNDTCHLEDLQKERAEVDF